jgi:hypothetical protein
MQFCLLNSRPWNRCFAYQSLGHFDPGCAVLFPQPGLITSHFLFSGLQKPIREEFFLELNGTEPCEPTPRCYIEFSGFPAPTVL